MLEEAFEPEDLARLTGVDSLLVAEELDRLCDRRLLCVDGFRFRFRYGIVREVLLRTVSPARRRVLRERLATGGGQGRPERIAPHAVPVAR